MGRIFTLTAPIKAVITQALDDLITELAKPCRLVYPPRFVTCANCVFDPIGQKSSNHWINGGPMPFADGMNCPLCNGNGRIAQEVSTPINLLCAWEPKAFFHPIPNLNIRAPYSVVQVKGYLTDMPKILECSYLVFETPIEGLLRKKFVLMGQPGDRSNIIQGRYFVATFEQTAE